uniref:Sarcolemmal membrane-associated protein-like isoform X2 n=1 Tax=Petromyzon marinus TaxID=7757 RepID=A0AAJ7T460_PETMA|nr:sarcolemmal membrane-associated protein-like isoform X2 [Petromyzon marinus]
MPWPQAVLSSRPDSHAFQERRLCLAEAVRVGRSVARCRAATNNATFDCKVLSRHHARLWYSDGKFLLQDTRSSNGTFVNGQRLGKSGEESAPYQLYSGDVLQFGVDVTENARKVTHGCIITMVKLLLPDGTEYKRRPEVDSASVKPEANSSTTLKLQDLHQLSHYLQEALYREQLLHKKLSALQTLLQSAQRASDDGWQALIIEDKLLSRLETLENRLMAYSKTLSDECLRKELELLQCDKGQYETAAKEALRRALQDKVEAHEKLASAQCALRCSDEELVHLQAVQEASRAEIKELALQRERAAQRVAQLEEQLQAALCESALKDESSQEELERRLAAMETHESALLTRIEQLTTENDRTRDLLAQAHELLKNGGRYPRDGDIDGEETETEGDTEPSPDRRDKEECLSTILEEPEDMRGYSQDGEAGTARSQAQEDSSVVSFSAREVLLELLSAQQCEDGDADAGGGGGDGATTLGPPWLRPGPGEEGEGPGEPAAMRARLADTQEIGRIFTARCGELEAMLEEEQEASTRQADVSSKSIQNLQAQLVSLREELESLRREKESELQEARRELTQVLEQARTLRHVLEDTATERENDIAMLQEELGRLRTELFRQQQNKSDSERPRSAEHGFTDSTRLRGHVERLEGECHGLRAECEELQRERDSLREQLHGLHKEIQSARVEEQELQEVVSGLQASRDSLASRRSAGPDADAADAAAVRDATPDGARDEKGSSLGDGAEEPWRAPGETAHTEAAPADGSEAGGGELQLQLRQAESVAESLQKKCTEAQLELKALQERHQATEQETRGLHEELELCREKLERYRKVKQKAWAGWLPLMAMVVGIAVSVLYPTME